MAKPLVRTLKCSSQVQGSQSTKVWQKKGLALIGSVGICVILLQKDVSFTAFTVICFRSGSESLMERWFCVINPRWNAEGYWSFSVRRAYQCCRCIKKEKKRIQSFLLKWGLLWYREGQVLIVFVESLLDPLQHYLYLLQRGVIFEQLRRQECWVGDNGDCKPIINTLPWNPSFSHSCSVFISLLNWDNDLPKCGICGPVESSSH